MTWEYTPTSELEAVNTMLTAIGEAPVNTLEDVNIADVATARKILHEISRDVQTGEWHFNTFDLTWTRDANEEYPVPPNVLRVSIDKDKNHGVQVVHLGDRLFNPETMSNKFDAERLEVKVILFFPFDQLPEPARRFITIKATRTFQDRFLGSDKIHAYTESDEQWAWVRLKETESDWGKYSLKMSQTIRRNLRR